jgi:LacI family transcriptional regulator
VQHLVALGHRRFGWLGGNIGLGRHEARFQAFQAALVRAGLRLDPRYTIKRQEADRAEGSEAVHAMLALSHRADFPTALVCYNTSMADGALKTLLREGWRVPRDLSIASADVSPVATAATPSITAAGSNPEKLGEAAARLVLDGSAGGGESFTDLMLPAQLFLGDSTGPAKK